MTHTMNTKTTDYTHDSSTSIRKGLSLEEKLIILSDAAKYDVACTSSGVDRRGKKGMLGNSCAAGVCHAFSADGRCISLLKILMTNHCAFDCKYCKSRRSNDIPRATFTPEEICELTISFYKRNYIEGLFLSSGILKNPNYTMEKMCETLRLLRTTYHFNGYIHVKAIPGASNELLYSAGLLADRISINMELPTQDSLRQLAPNKTMQNILRPMNQVSETIAAHRLATGKTARMERAGINQHLVHSIWGNDVERISTAQSSSIQSSSIQPSSIQSSSIQPSVDSAPPQISGSDQKLKAIRQSLQSSSLHLPAESSDLQLHRSFASAGQSTQMIIGATSETDFELIRTTQNLYQAFDLKRVFYSGYIPLNEDSSLPALGTPVPMLREHRLYQADWLMRYYGFFAEELLSQNNPFFDQQLDPKCFWAIHHLEQFPVEINTAPAELLLRVPGIGPLGVKKILSARRYGHVNFEMLKKMHIVLKRAQYFITCNGRMLYHIPLEEHYIHRQLTALEKTNVMQIQGQDITYTQMNLFSDFHLQGVQS